MAVSPCAPDAGTRAKEELMATKPGETTLARQIAPPEPELTPDQMLARAVALRPLLRARQAECEVLGRVPDAVNAELVKAGFYRIVQPRRFGGYEFEVPTFYRVMMDVARGCPETGWVLCLTAGHPMLLAAFTEQAQVEAYGADGEFRCPASFNPPATAVPVDGGYRVSGGLVSASGIDIGTHFVGMAIVKAEDQAPVALQFLLERSQFEAADDWHVIGMQGTGSKRVDIRDAFVPEHRTVRIEQAFRGAQAAPRGRLYDNPMYSGRIQPFLIGEAAAVAVGGAKGALDHFAESLKGKRGMFPPHLERTQDPEYLHHYGRALALISTAEAALIRAGEDYMDYARADAAGDDPFGEEKEHRLTLIEQQCVHLAWEATELIFRTAGTTASARQGAAIGRVFRNLAVINTHPALQIDRTAVAAAKAHFGPG
jgi:3-hydroxy-9,10-secoandrosta-1,3,5(10)-triene-9,17-dione monooxygenase